MLSAHSSRVFSSDHGKIAKQLDSMIHILPPHYIIVIDALDEIEEEGGSRFLRNLLDYMNLYQLRGLKIFVTSRSDPALVKHVESFEEKQLYRLEEVPLEEA